MNIYVSNLSFNLQDEELREIFMPFGEVKSARIIKDKDTGKSRGFGFVEMADDASSRTAIAELNGKPLGDRTLTVNEAKPKPERNSRNWS